LVANSPGLIAGSYVLHRLLVPRHPPIALSSLSHNKKLQRCSRPLCSSQNTGRNTNPDTPPTDPRPTTEGKHTPATDPSRRFGEGWPQPHHHTNHDPQRSSAGAVSDPEKPEQPVTGPARSLRTQQRASTIHSTPSTFHTHPQKGASSTSFSDSAAYLMVNVPQSEAPPPQDRRLRNGE
jgi:hypothetical protein